MANVHLLIIDPQNDFMDAANAALPVPGANADMDRLAEFIRLYADKISHIHVTLDSHQEMDIAHTHWWLGKDGDMVKPFTKITAEQVEAGHYTTRDPDKLERSISYLKALGLKGKEHTIWLPHCLVDTLGHNVQDNLLAAISKWQNDKKVPVNYVTKGTNQYTEHYGALCAEVEYDDDPSTQLNKDLLDKLRTADIILVAGEALSHCVKATVEQMVEYIGTEYIKKINILEDTSSSVKDSDDYLERAKKWLVDIHEKSGVGVVTTNTAAKLFK